MIKKGVLHLDQNEFVGENEGRKRRERKEKEKERKKGEFYWSLTVKQQEVRRVRK